MTRIEELYSLFRQSRGVSIDSRTITEDQLFFGIKGDRFDGNAYALKAIQGGALVAVVDDPELKEEQGCFFVDDALNTLQELARHHKRQIQSKIIAITGSNGKTTSKELICEVLKTRYKTQATAGNLNNHIGVPLTLLSLKDETELAVVEMGANHKGEIDQLCRIAEPDQGVITNIGRAHLEGFGGIEGVKIGKSELYKYLGEKAGVIFCDVRQKYLCELLPKNGRVQYYAGPEGSGRPRWFVMLSSRLPGHV